ncbi:hypothetical protein ALI22I_21345 [Saccharothrix sp. ALI-22-I]|nr:hypothetical protein ALI22I_21345 [Saccharothrix sp. ALI-22-I]
MLDIARLTRMRNSLRHASTCRHEPLVECPDFKREFEPSGTPAGPPESDAQVGDRRSASAACGSW